MDKYDYAADMAEQTLLTKKRNKKKLNDLLDKYGSKEGIEQNANLQDSFAYMFCQGDELIDDVLQERQLARQQSASLQTPHPSQAKDDYDCYMLFDGQNLKLYKNLQQIDKLDAQSGQDEFQSAKHQKVANKGPIPEGTYYANQDQRQDINALEAIIGTVAPTVEKIVNRKLVNWSGGPVAWGLRRVWLKPDAQTNTYGRSGFSIHGGAKKGSAGCIDIPGQTDKLSKYLDNCQDSVPVRVKYPQNW